MAILSSTGIAGFLSSVKATGKQVLNHAGKLIPEYVGDFVSGISGWIIRNNGEAEFKSVYARDKFITNEFVYNRIKVTEDEEILSSSIKIASFIDNGNGTYSIYPDLREGDINPLANDDLLVGYYHNPANSGVIYAIQKFLALDDPNSENQSIILEPVGDSLPYQHMIIVRVGNVHDMDRQSFIRISSRTNCQYFYDGINSWEAYDDPKSVKCVLGKADIGLIPAWAVSVIGSVKRWFGLIADGVILRGTFVLQSSNKTVETELEGVNTTITDIETRFEVKEGQIAASVKQAEKYATSASDNAGFADEAANAATGILNTVKEREASINITAQGIESKVGEIETQVDAATGILQNISEKEASINQTAEGFQSTVSETTKKAVDDAVAGADAAIEEKVSTQVTQSAREWKVEVMGAYAEDFVETGIDISNRKITLKADTTVFKNNAGEDIAVFENDKIKASMIDVDNLEAKKVKSVDSYNTKLTLDAMGLNVGTASSRNLIELKWGEQGPFSPGTGRLVLREAALSSVVEAIFTGNALEFHVGGRVRARLSANGLVFYNSSGNITKSYMAQ